MPVHPFNSGSNAPNACAEYDAGIIYDQDGGVIRYGATDPQYSVVLDVGGFYAMPSSNYHGYCFTFSDSTDNTPGGTSTITPPCGNTGPCYTVASGLCSTAILDKANGSISWGGGIGCNLNQKQGTGTRAGYTALTGMTSVTVEVYGCKVPDKLQLQINISNPPIDPDSGILGDGYFCNIATLSAPDANGMRGATVPITSLKQDCWNPGPLPALDPSLMTATSIQVQLNSDPAKVTTWDFCISKLLIE